MRKILAVIFATLIAIGPPSATFAQTRIDANEMRGRIATARIVALEAASAPSEERMNAVRTALGLPVVIAMPWGDLQVDSSGLDDLGGDPADFQFALAHLDVLDDAIREAATSMPANRARVQQAIDGSYRGINANRNIIQRIRGWIGAALASVLEGLVRAAGEGLGRVIAILSAIVVTAGAVWLIFRRMRVVSDRVLREQTTGDRVDWRALLQQAESRGDLEGAIRAQYHVLLEELAARGIVLDVRSLTAGECRLAVAGTRPALYPIVSDATNAFERVAYGHSAAQPEHLDALQRATAAAKAS